MKNKSLLILMFAPAIAALPVLGADAAIAIFAIAGVFAIMLADYGRSLPLLVRPTEVSRRARQPCGSALRLAA